jgi:galactokinase
MQFDQLHSFNGHLAETEGRGIFFQSAEPVWLARAPGRLDVMGGNVDYTGGLVLQMPLRQAVCAAVQATREPMIRVSNPGAAQLGWATELAIPGAAIADLEAIESVCSQSPGAHWGRYVLGGFHLLNSRYGCYERSGANVLLFSDLPANRGLASSAALEIAVLKAAAAASEVELAGVALAESAQWVENVVAHAACGIMDQAAIALGRADCLLPLVCQPCQPLPSIPLPAQLRIWGIDSMVPRATNSRAYENARAAAFMGYKMICRWEGLEPVPDPVSPIARWTDARWNGYLSNITPSQFRAAYERRLPDGMLGRDFVERFGRHVDPFTVIDPAAEYPVCAAVRYAVEENHRIEMTRLVLESFRPENAEDALEAMGELMYQSHLAYAECGLGAEACDRLVALARQYGFYGAKMTGGGAGGVVAVLGTAGQEEALAGMIADYATERGTAPQIFEGSSDGADRFGVQMAEVCAAAEMV